MMKIEQSHDLKTFGNYGVLVVGSGPAGACAAISSARMGTPTAIIERYGIVGGNLTTGVVGPVMGGVSDGTINEEIWARLGIIPRSAHDYEQAKIELALLLDEAGADLYLQSALADVIMDEDRVAGVVVATPDGLFALYGDVIVDATGDGTVAYLAGAPYEFGRGEDGLVQPISLMFVLGGVSEDAIYCQGVNPDVKIPQGDFVQFCIEACARGELPEKVNTVRIYHSMKKTERMVNATQVNYVNTVSVKELSKGEAVCRPQTNPSGA